MKKFMLRGSRSARAYRASANVEALEYGVWYELVTPFSWLYFRLKKGSRKIVIRDSIYGGNYPVAYEVSRKVFINEFIRLAKSPVRKVSARKLYDECVPGATVRAALAEKLDRIHEQLVTNKNKFVVDDVSREKYANYLEHRRWFDITKYVETDEEMDRILAYNFDVNGYMFDSDVKSVPNVKDIYATLDLMTALYVDMGERI